MMYDIRHRTTFTYEDVVSVSHHVLHLSPRRHPRQRALETAMLIDPSPAVDSQGSDYFGNPVHYLTVQEPHEAFQFVFDSPYSVADEDVRDYALQSFVGDRPVLEAAMDLTSRIYGEFEYRGGVSDVSTPVRDVFGMRKGVCQDFAHLEIACLRSLGLAARYVSGYLRTRPPEGKEKLVGADASHAWLSVWCGSNGWVDFDPTNNVIPNVEHITIGLGSRLRRREPDQRLHRRRRRASGCCRRRRESCLAIARLERLYATLDAAPASKVVKSST
jgi:transglutaminase-like putative cysteine protease